MVATLRLRRWRSIPTTPAEQAYLAMLASRLKLDPGSRLSVEQEVAKFAPDDRATPAGFSLRLQPATRYLGAMSSDRPSIVALVYEAFQRLFADEAIPLAGNIAFRTLFSIFPFLIFLTALAGFFGNADLADTVVVYLLERRAGTDWSIRWRRRSIPFSPCRAPACSASRPSSPSGAPWAASTASASASTAPMI